MDSFSIEVDLKSFFNDYRAKSIVLVDTNSMKKVKHVVKHIKTLFGIESKTYVSSRNNFVPGAEDSRVLQTLSIIRLETLSSNQCYNESESNDNGEQQELVSKPIKKRKQDKVSDTDEISDTGQKKKHRRKREKEGTKKNDGNNEYSMNQQNISDDLPNVADSLDSLEDGKVRKTTSNKLPCSSAEACSPEDNIEGKRKDTPNRIFYDKVYTHDQDMIEGNQKRSAFTGFSRDTCDINDEASSLDNDNMSNTGETTGEKTECDLNATADLLSSPKPRRKRIRKRKRAAKPEVVLQSTETTVLQTVRYPLPKTTKASTLHSSHIFFSEEGEERSETPEEMQEEEKVDEEDISGSSTLKCPDNKAEDWKEEELNNPIAKPDLAVSVDPVKHIGIDVAPTANLPVPEKIAQPKRYSIQAARGLGKLLSLVRSENPPVFERKKIESTPPQSRSSSCSRVAGLPTDKTPTIHNSLPPVENPNVPILFPDNTPNPAFSLQNNVILTPLKSIPEEKTKISFKILKMSASYCPELSNAIVAIVKEINHETQELSLKILEGAEECQKPKGKFDLDYEVEEEENRTDDIKLNWQELIEPNSCQ